jgi:hypothetical protein
MITIEVLRQVSVCYVHGHCPDGLASAMIFLKPYIETKDGGANDAITAASLVRHGWAEYVDTHDGFRPLTITESGRAILGGGESKR